MSKKTESEIRQGVEKWAGDFIAKCRAEDPNIQKGGPSVGKYDVKFYGSDDKRMDYWDRQQAANKDGAVCYVEGHFNSSSNSGASYAVTILGSNASTTSQNWGRWFAKAVATRFGTKVAGDDGILIGGYGGRGDYNIKYTKMPAILLEPMFCSNPAQAEIIKSEDGRAALAQILVDSIIRFFPDGGLVAFSVGHKYKASNPNDLGAGIYGGGYEATYAEKVLLNAAHRIKELGKVKEAGVEKTAGRVVTIEVEGEVVGEYTIDPDAWTYYDIRRDRLIVSSNKPAQFHSADGVNSKWVGEKDD